MMVHFNHLYIYLQVLFVADHLQTEKSMLARGLKAFIDKVMWMAVSAGEGAISALWNHMCTLCIRHTEQKYSLTAKKSWKTQMPLPSLKVIWKLPLGEGYHAVPTSNHYFKTANFLTGISVFNPKHNVLAECQILNELGVIFTFSFYHMLLDNFQPKISPKRHQQQHIGDI